MSIDRFVFDRILDTTAGIILGLLGEMLIFPKSAMHKVRDDLSHIFGGFYDITQGVIKKSDMTSLNEKISYEDELFLELKRNIKAIKHEPIVYLSKRSGYIHAIYATILCFFEDFKRLVHSYIPCEHDLAAFNSLSRSMQVLQSLTPNTKSAELSPSILELQAIVIQLKNGDKSPQSLTLINIFDNAIKILQLYQQALSISYWRPKWQSLPDDDIDYEG